MPHRPNSPAFPINKKNHTLPVRLINRGIAYPGLRNKSRTVYKAFSTFLFIQLFCGESTAGRDGGWKFTAARRMKGVVRPQAMPTRRKPSVQRKMEGEGGEGESPASIAGFRNGSVRGTRQLLMGKGWARRKCTREVLLDVADLGCCLWKVTSKPLGAVVVFRAGQGIDGTLSPVGQGIALPGGRLPTCKCASPAMGAVLQLCCMQSMTQMIPAIFLLQPYYTVY